MRHRSSTNIRCANWREGQSNGITASTRLLQYSQPLLRPAFALLDEPFHPLLLKEIHTR